MNAPQSSKNTIAVAVDMSETGDHALREAMRLSRQLPGSELHVIYVLRTEKGLHDANRLDELARELPNRLDQLRAHVTSVCAPGTDGVAYSQETVFHIRLGDPAAAIHQAAVDVDADLIVVGTHGRRGMDKLLLGSVAEELVRMAHLPVVVARPKDFGGLRLSERPDAPKPGQDLHSTGVSQRSHLEFRPRNSHISGLL